MKIVVSVGTDHHPFDRLLAWMRSWSAPDGVAVFVQSGETAAADGLDCRPYLAVEELDAAMADAVAVVCHAGPGTILQARVAGHVPIVVPRRPELGEHVDGHQVRFARWMADRDQIEVADDEQALHRALDRAVSSPTERRMASATDAIAVSTLFGDLVETLVRYPPR